VALASDAEVTVEEKDEGGGGGGRAMAAIELVCSLLRLSLSAVGRGADTAEMRMPLMAPL
jgi:hypothetical protein